VLLTLVDTGVAMLHAINERVARACEERQRPMPRALRPGYGLLTCAFTALLVLPALSRHRPHGSSADSLLREAALERLASGSRQSMNVISSVPQRVW
jgi:hypothetical protein